MTFNCMIAGVGGQGTVLASKLLAAAAIKRGYSVRTTETIGMAQRGGSVVSHVRIGDAVFSPLIPLNSADALIAFEPAEAVRQLVYLRRSEVLPNTSHRGTEAQRTQREKRGSSSAVSSVSPCLRENLFSDFFIQIRGTGGIVLVCDRAIKPAAGQGAYEAGTMIDYLKANAPRLVVIDGQSLIAQSAKTLNVALLGAAVKTGIFPFDAETLKEVLKEMLPERFLEMNLKAFETGQELSVFPKLG